MKKKVNIKIIVAIIVATIIMLAGLYGFITGKISFKDFVDISIQQVKSIDDNNN